MRFLFSWDLISLICVFTIAWENERVGRSDLFILKVFIWNEWETIWLARNFPEIARNLKAGSKKGTVGQ